MKKSWTLARLMFNIASLADLGRAVTSSKGFHEKMKTALYVVTGMFSVPRAALFLYDAKRRSLELLTSKGLRGTDDISLSLKGARMKTFAMNEPRDLREMRGTSFYRTNDAAFKRLQTKTFLPLFAKNGFVGALTLGRRLDRASYLRSERDVLKVVAHQMAITLHNSRLFIQLTKKAGENKKLYENMRRIYHDTIQAFAAAIDAKDAYTKNHSYRVALYAVAIARELGWREADVEGIYVAGLLHDIGKIIIDRSVINKGEKLTPQEISEIKKHPQISYDILSKIRFPWKDVAHFAKHHHERLDGRGYPDSLIETDLSEGIRILALADAFDAMVTDRPYREKLSLTEAVREIERGMGTQFDSKISRVFFKLLQKDMKGEVRGALTLQAFPLGSAGIRYDA